MSAPVLTKEARERLERVARGQEWMGREAWEHDAMAALAHIDALEAELDAENTRLIDALSELRGVREFTIPALEARVAVLAAECRAWRVFDYENWPSSDKVDPSGECEVALHEARAATDAAGALEGVGK